MPVVFVPGWRSTSRAEAVPQLAREAPAALGHVPERLWVERAPEVLLKAGLADGLAAGLAGQVESTGYSAERDPGTKVVNPQAISD